MYSFDYPRVLNPGRVCLEMSLKPFKELSDGYIEGVVKNMFEQWLSLIKHSNGVAVMLWTSDGSEVLEYDGDLTREFEWGKYIGIGNPSTVHRERGGIWDDERYVHVKPALYIENPPVMHYADLKRIISAIKIIGKQMTGFDVVVGETFDPGPEFAVSDFKFNRHNELNCGTTMDDAWIHCTKRLHADNHKYAAFPNGIPEGTSFGEFLSKQFEHLKKDIGFDYLWLSNGFGFSLESWNWTGEVFDGKAYNKDKSQEVRESICEFWREYTKNTDFTTEVRGSNLSTAMDIASHGCPIDEIYKNDIIGPPNSPWAALDSRFGLELVGYMSHIANVPEKGYGFRYYTHDPWWINSPWFDRYARLPHDIYLPLAVTRMDENGNTQKPYGINILSIDDSLGDLQERCPVEVIPHILEGYRSYPDSPGLVTWLYPFETYCEMGKSLKNDRIMMDDWFIENAIDNGFPMNTVVSDTVFSKSDISTYVDTCIVTPVPEDGSLLEKCVFKAIDAGIRILLYGNTFYASEKLREYIGVKIGCGLDGEITLVTDLQFDKFEISHNAYKTIHEPWVSNGKIHEMPEGKTELLVTADINGDTRAYATFNSVKNIAWIRGSFPYANSQKTRLPGESCNENNFSSSKLMRPLLSRLGIDFSFESYKDNDKLPLILTHGFNGGYYFTVYAKDNTVISRLSTRHGAPVITNTTCFIENNTSTYNFPNLLHEECRVFVEQQDKSKVVCRVETAGDTLHNDRRISITGLKDAVVRFMPEKNSAARFYQDDPNKGNLYGKCWGDSDFDIEYVDGFAVIRNVCGRIYIAWQSNETRKEYLNKGMIVE